MTFDGNQLDPDQTFLDLFTAMSKHFPMATGNFVLVFEEDLAFESGCAGGDFMESDQRRTAYFTAPSTPHASAVGLLEVAKAAIVYGSLPSE